MLRPFAHLLACCWMLFRVVAQSVKPVKLFSQQLPLFLLFRDRQGVAQQCWIRLDSSFNIVGATHAHYLWITKTYGLYPSHDALQIPRLLGVVASVCTTMFGVVASVCTQPKTLRINSQQQATTCNRVRTDATCNIQQCWEMLANNVGFRMLLGSG